MKTILLHGNGQSKDVWHQLDQKNLLSYDLLGHGDAPRSEEYSLDSHAEYIASKISEPVNLIGHSLGGHIAIRVGRLKPKLVKKIISLAMAPLRNIKEMESYFIADPRLIAIYQENPTKEAIQDFCDCMQAGNENKNLIYKMFLKQDSQHRIKLAQSFIQKFDNEVEIVNSLNCPFEIFIGDNDPVINRNFVENSDFNVTFVRNSGHNIMLDRPEFLHNLDR